MLRRDDAQPLLAALDVAVKNVNTVGNTRITGELAAGARDLIADLLDDVDAALKPHDERLQESRQLLRETARALLGPGPRDVAIDELPEVARSIRRAAGVAMNADINVLLQEISEAAKIYAKPEYGPRSRWQALRDEIKTLNDTLAEARGEATAIVSDLTNTRIDLEAERIRTTSLQEQVEKLTNRDSATGLALLRVREILGNAQWDDAGKAWAVTDEQRREILDV